MAACLTLYQETCQAWRPAGTLVLKRNNLPFAFPYALSFVNDTIKKKSFFYAVPSPDDTMPSTALNFAYIPHVGFFCLTVQWLPANPQLSRSPLPLPTYQTPATTHNWMFTVIYFAQARRACLLLVIALAAARTHINKKKVNHQIILLTVQKNKRQESFTDTGLT